MRKKQFIRLLKKYRQGKATKEECKFIESYYDLFEAEPGMENWLNEEEKGRLKREIKTGIEKSILPRELKGVKRKRWSPAIIKIAAAIAVLMVLGIGFYELQDRTQTEPEKVASAVDSTVIQPGGNKAILTLGNGRKIALDSNSKGKLAQQSFLNISEDSGTIVYAGGKNNGRENIYNTITTPYGGEYKVILADGTKVWLNAGSSLRYPVAFNGKERRVTLSGEAYFEVTPHSSGSLETAPFIVEAGGMEVKVLGTHFNVNAYEEGKTVSTTLAEGAVKVTKGNKNKLLHPGEQAVLNKEKNKLSVGRVNVDQMLAWKNELFYFDDTNIRTIMQKIARWYDVEVRYNIEDLSKKNFSGIMSRYSDVEAVLKRMELTGTIHFEVEGRTITVKE